MNRRLMASAVLVLILPMGATLAACGNDAGSAPATKNPRELDDGKYLSILDKNGVLATESDAELVKLGRQDVCEDPLVDGFQDLVAARLRYDAPSLDDYESGVVVQAAVKVFCPEHSDSS